MSRRLDRLNEQLKREIAQRVRRDVRDPRIGFVTITAVRVSPDLSHARVLVRIAGDREQVAQGMEGLEAAGPYLRRALGAELRIRRAPELHFEIDETLDQALRIEEILQEVRPEEGWDESGDEAAPVPAGPDGDLSDADSDASDADGDASDSDEDSG